MMKHIRIAIVFVCLLLPILGFGLYKNNKNFYVMSRGNYFFQNTRNNVNIETVILDFGYDVKITITLREGLWRIKEVDDYFASAHLINALFKFINNTVIYRTDNLNDSDVSQYLTDSVKITSIDNKGNTLDEATVSLDKNAAGYLYATLNGLPYFYQINGAFNISALILDWVHSPIISIKSEDIKRIDTSDFSIYRRFEGDDLKRADTNEIVFHIERLVKNLHNLIAKQIKHISNLDKTKLQKIKHYDVTLLNGLIYKIDIFKNNDEYWLNIKLDKTLLATEKATQILKERSILYDGWFFMIDSSKGQIISDFIL